MATRANSSLHRYSKGDVIATTAKDGSELNLIIIGHYGEDLFGASILGQPDNKSFYDLHERIYTVNRDLL